MSALATLSTDHAERANMPGRLITRHMLGRSLDGIKPVRPDLFPGDVHLWLVSTEPDREQIDQLEALLDRAEQQRADAYRFEVDRDRFIIRHAIRRRILELYVPVAAAELQFEFSMHGKPMLLHGGTSGLQFNESHSADLAIYAISARSRVGVDVEQIRTLPDADDIFDAFASSTEKAVWAELSADHRQRGFLRWWTAKEAYGKAAEVGLCADLSRFSVDFRSESGPTPICVRSETGEQSIWWLTPIAPAAGYVGGLVVEAVPLESGD